MELRDVHYGTAKMTDGCYTSPSLVTCLLTFTVKCATRSLLIVPTTVDFDLVRMQANALREKWLVPGYFRLASRRQYNRSGREGYDADCTAIWTP
jgi:hypothetical protein